jgi:iron complex transport system ATP-binding protein
MRVQQAQEGRIAIRPYIEINNMTVRYGVTAALEDVSVEIARGESVAVIGPNGSGKSTFLRALGGLVRPASGSIVLDGSPLAVRAPRGLARLVAYVPQDTAVLFEFSVREIVAMGRSPYLSAWGFESRDDLAAIDDAIALMDLGELADRSILEVSGGERQRAMIARALAQQPAVLLLDEPAANLDLKYQVRLYALLDRLTRTRGLTTIIVSHDLNAVSSCNRLIVLRNGRLHGTGPPADVLTETLVEEVYGCRASIDTHPRTRAPRVTLDWEKT